MDAITAQASMGRSMAPSQQAVQVHGHKRFDVRWLHITVLLVLMQELSSENTEAPHEGLVGRELCTGFTLLLSHN